MMIAVMRSLLGVILIFVMVTLFACRFDGTEQAATGSPSPTTTSAEIASTLEGGPSRVIISSPKAGQQLEQNQKVEIEYEALDNQGIRRVDLLVDDTVVNTNEFVPQPGSVFVAKISWRPDEPGAHTLQVQVYNPLGTIGRSAKIMVQVTPSGTQTPTSTPFQVSAPPTDTPSPTPPRTPTTRQGDVLPTFTASPTPASPYLIVRVQSGLNVRMGPSTQYQVVGFLPPGTQAEILGQNNIGAGNWWLISFEQAAEGRGWVSASPDYSESFNTANVPIVVAPATPVPPTPTPTPTPVPTIQQTQIVFEADRTQIRAGECVTVFWDVSNAKEVYYRGQGVPGERQGRVECPTLTEFYELRVVKPDGQIESETIRIEVVGTGTKSAELDLGEGIDFDEDGKVSSSGDDFKWVKENGERRFKKWDGDDDIELVPIGPMGLDIVTQNDCRRALDELDDTESIEPFPGLVACFRTDESRMGILRFEDVEDDVDFEWALWE